MNTFSKVFILLILIIPRFIGAQEISEFPSLTGSWEGPLVIGRDSTNLAFTFSIKDGQYAAALISGGMGIYGMPADMVRVDGANITIRIPRLDVEFTGTIRLNDSGDQIVRIDGDWFQYSEMVPVVLLRMLTNPPFDSPNVYVKFRYFKTVRDVSIFKTTHCKINFPFGFTLVAHRIWNYNTKARYRRRCHGSRTCF